METNTVIQDMKQKVESLWAAIQKATGTPEQSRLRELYRDAMGTYQLQKLIAQGRSAQAG